MIRWFPILHMTHKILRISCSIPWMHQRLARCERFMKFITMKPWCYMQMGMPRILITSRLVVLPRGNAITFPCRFHTSLPSASLSCTCACLFQGSGLNWFYDGWKNKIPISKFQNKEIKCKKTAIAYLNMLK